MKVAIVGMGRMGRAVEAVALARGHEVVARIDVNGDAAGRPLKESVRATRPDVAIEFTQPSTAKANVAALLELRVPVVCGTTGWQPAEIEPLTRQAGTPALVAPNFSIGVAVMKRLAKLAATALRAFPDFEPAMMERHHKAKLDAPSGTARMLADTVAQAAGLDNVPVAALRHGGQPGEHTLIFEGQAETLTICHQARSREIFALGAVHAAEWLVEQKPQGLIDFDTFLERTGTWKTA